MRLLFVGDFRTDLSSGYSVILEAICTELSRLGHNVTVLGTDWDRGEHSLEFQVIPSDFSWVPTQVTRLRQALQFEHVILTMDIPKIISLTKEVRRQNLQWPTCSALFPIESDPLLPEWQSTLGELAHLFVISEFGRGVLGDCGFDSTLVPMTSTELTAPRTKQSARALLMPLARSQGQLLAGSSKIALTVADNQERKDLPVIGQALSHLRDEHDLWVTWALVTSIEAPYGWRLKPLWERLWINDQVVMFQGLTRGQLGLAYRAADVFVLSSQAEGACLPLYEAMAHSLPIVAPAHTAVTEAIAGDRGELVLPSRCSIHPWGNVTRYHTDPEELADAIGQVLLNDSEKLIQAGRKFIDGRSWKDAAVRIEETLRG